VPGFSESVTLGEFIRRAKELGVQLRHSPSLAEGPKGLVRFYYLTRGDEPATILNWCETLDLPKEDLGL